MFPAGGYQPGAPQYPSAAQHPSSQQAPHGGFRHSEPAAGLARTSSAPVGAESGAGYELNGKYDSDFKPPAEKIADAHKISRFAVSALAFDDVPTAIEYLRKSLELLTSPTATVD